MGMDFAQLAFLDAAAKQGAVLSPMLGLGSLTLRQTPEEIDRFAAEHAYSKLQREGTIGALLHDRYGIADYRDCDVNGMADVHLDLIQPIEEKWVGAFGSIFNGGTLEHLLDLRQSLENLHRMVRPQGTFLHAVPVSWFNHAFVNFNPCLFHALARSNAYDVLVEGYYFMPHTLPQDNPHPVVRIVHPSHHDTDGKHSVDTLLSAPSIPANMMYLVALRKRHDTPFKAPYDIAN